MATRIISAGVGLVIVFTVFAFHKTIVLPLAVALIIAIMLFELLRVVKMEKNIPILIASELCGISMPFIYNSYYIISSENGENIRSINGQTSFIAFIFTLIPAFAIFITWLKNNNKITYDKIFFVLACMILIPQSMTCLVRIERYSSSHGLLLLVLGLCGAWIADSGAYFAGVALGKHKLCPEISPKKTIEGFIGGILTTGIIFFAVVFVYEKFITKSPANIRVSDYMIISAIGMICAVIGTIGDLSASMVKRQTGIKDYGKIMPGHGGMMDRFDSVIFVVPTFYAFIAFSGIIDV